MHIRHIKNFLHGERLIEREKRKSGKEEWGGGRKKISRKAVNII